MITPPLSISARPVFTRNVARSATANPIVEGGSRAPDARSDESQYAGLTRWRVGKPRSTRRLGAAPGGRVQLRIWRNYLGSTPPDPGISHRSGSPPGPVAFVRPLVPTSA